MFFMSIIEPAMIPPGAFGGGKPPPPPRVVNTDFYRGKVKSIYEREPLFQVMSLYQSNRYSNHDIVIYTLFNNIIKIIEKNIYVVGSGLRPFCGA